MDKLKKANEELRKWKRTVARLEKARDKKLEETRRKIRDIQEKALHRMEEVK